MFFCIETISPPAGSGLPPITHWPGLISGVVSKTLDGVDDGSASVNPAWTAFGAAPPDNKKQRIAWLHSIRPLGMFSTSAELHGKATSDMLPWAAGAQLLGGPEGWRQIGSEANRFLCEGAVLEAKEDPPQESDLLSDELDKRWRTRWGERIKFEKLPKAWNDAVLRLSIALSNGEVGSICATPLTHRRQSQSHGLKPTA